MSFLEFPIRRYQFTLVAFLCLVALGWYAFSSVPREEDPYFKIPGFTVAAIYPGADPKDLERLIAKPLEDRFAALDDVLKMETSIRDGVAGNLEVGVFLARHLAEGEPAECDQAQEGDQRELVAADRKLEE